MLNDIIDVTPVEEPKEVVTDVNSLPPYHEIDKNEKQIISTFPTE